MRRLFAVLVGSSLMLTAFVGCSQGSNTQPETGSNESQANSNESKEKEQAETGEASEPKQELVFANFRDIRDPNPHLYQGEMWFQEMVYETLVSVEPSGVEPCLAESWQISEDGLTYTFDIREGIYFTDGELCDANAIEANFDAIWDNIDRHVWMESARLISSYDALDDYTFEIKLSEPYYPLLIELGVTRPYGIASPKSMKDGTTKDGVTEYIGTGTYKLAEHKPDEYTTMVANEDYWGEAAKIPTVTMKVIPDNQTRIMALEKGEVDLIYGGNLLDTVTMSQYEGSEEFTPSISEPTLTKHLLLNSSNPVLADEKVRYAITHAVDKHAIAEGIFYGVEPVADFLYAKSVPYCDIPLEPFAYDPALSEQLLEEDGWVKGSDGVRAKDGQRLSLRFVYDNNSVIDKTLCEFIQAEMAGIGIEVKLEGFERQTYFDMLKAGEFDITINIPWGNPYDPHAALSSMRGPVYGDYEAQLGLPNKAELDAAITEVFVTVDEAKRQELYTHILTELHESALYIPLVYETNKALHSSDLKGVGFKTSSYVTPFWDMYFE